MGKQGDGGLELEGKGRSQGGRFGRVEAVREGQRSFDERRKEGRSDTN